MQTQQVQSILVTIEDLHLEHTCHKSYQLTRTQQAFQDHKWPA